ncbi:hypothetical protein EA472_02860 [Natrarchaeobius oligotrophus]|uniref:Uncharacterized protein n=1 Tax=Natrarchaeobius chitinivorans TaxID=1679083 RepID=A0A3N6MHH9_NATCH|nr:hypothetical protein EA472_02860 [Natrarchaeobius chitinivorans]
MLGRGGSRNVDRTNAQMFFLDRFDGGQRSSIESISDPEFSADREPFFVPSSSDFFTVQSDSPRNVRTEFRSNRVKRRRR